MSRLYWRVGTSPSDTGDIEIAIESVIVIAIEIAIAIAIAIAIVIEIAIEIPARSEVLNSELKPAAADCI
ncbi:MAG: hypothetical protein R2828_06225 [Saprospiraceae bacterium]